MSPRLIYFNLFDDCNARCNMCECWRMPRSRRPTEHYVEILDRVLDLRPAALRFTGGEPLLLRGLPDLVRRAWRAGARVSVISNGGLLRSRVAALAEAGCAEVVVSLDGIGPVHNRIRQTSGLFERCLAGLDAVAETGMAYGVNTVVQQRNVDDIPKLASLLLERVQIPAWWHLIPVRDNNALIPTALQRHQLGETLLELINRMSAQGIGMVADPAMFDPQAPVGCEVPAFTAYVKAETGEVYGCNMLAYADGAVGDLRKESASDVWSASRAEELRARCAAGVNLACARCDPSSRAMNHLLGRRAVEPKMEGAAR